MSGGGSRRNSYTRPEEIREKLINTQDELKQVTYKSDVNTIIDSNLASYNRRDTEAITRHMGEIKKALYKEIGDYVQTSFGGSVSKHTYVDGLSDIDALVIINDTELVEKSPEKVLDFFFETLKSRFQATKIDKGNLAVTLNFSDSQIQLLPAIKDEKGLRIADQGGKQWSDIIKPNVFARALRIKNAQLNGKLVPVIKLVKALVSNLPTSSQISGYHCEAMALKIFQNYSYDGQTTKDLLKYYFNQAVSHIRTPIKDKTGQSVHVDAYLGGKESLARLKLADTFARICRRMDEADSTLNPTFWKENLEQNGGN